MLGQPERALRAGVVVCFRLEGTNDLLWTARMSALPATDDTCVRIADGVETEYKVEQVRFEFLHRNAADVIGYVDGVPQYGDFVPSTTTYIGPVVMVSAI